MVGVNVLLAGVSAGAVVLSPGIHAAKPSWAIFTLAVSAFSPVTLKTRLPIAVPFAMPVLFLLIMLAALRSSILILPSLIFL